jgi:hypothetical protein
MLGFRSYRGRDYALDHGVDEKALEEYVSGACVLYRRKEIEAVLSRCDWAMKKVVEIIKAQR